MSIEALVFDVDGTLADTEEVHRTAFNLAFERFGLGWYWDRPAYRQLLSVAGGKERLRAFIAELTVTRADQQRLLALLPAIHAEKTKLYSAVVRDGALSLREGVQRLIDEAQAAGCRLAIASTTTRLSPNLRDDMAISGSKGCGTKRGVGLRRTARILHRPVPERIADREKPDFSQRNTR